MRRAIATVILTADLAYPACAAVCPKGIGNCTSPGRCFLFVDADGNALCDYTARSGSQAQTGPFSSAPVQTDASIPPTTTPTPGTTTAQVTAVPAPTQPATPVAPVSDTTTSVLQNTSTGGFLDTIHLSVPIAEVILFLVFAGILFAIIRSGILGIRIEKTLTAFAFSSLFALGFSLISTSFLAGGAIAGTTLALCYIGPGTLLTAYLWHSGVMTRQIALGVAGLSMLTGFIFLAPIMPMELGSIINAVTGVSALTVGVIVICAIVAITPLLGRTFCGTICPVGSLQELAYAIPLTKRVIRKTEYPELIRLAVFTVTVIAALYLVDLMAVTGLYDLFSLTLTAGFIVAAGILILSIFLYRPVCRIICPFGVLFSLFAEFSWFRLQRTKTCIRCRKCEKACPTRTSGEHDSKRECYLCGRCTGACPIETAISYRH